MGKPQKGNVPATFMIAPRSKHTLSEIVLRRHIREVPYERRTNSGVVQEALRLMLAVERGGSIMARVPEDPTKPIRIKFLPSEWFEQFPGTEKEQEDAQEAEPSNKVPEES